MILQGKAKLPNYSGPWSTFVQCPKASELVSTRGRA